MDHSTSRNSTPETADRITMFGAAWCNDCRRAKALLDELGADYDYLDLEVEPDAAERARAISGRTNIPVITFPDGSHLVEPDHAELRARVAQHDGAAA